MTERVTEYQTVAAKRAAAARQLEELSRVAQVNPVLLEGASYARGYWSRLWRRNFEQMPLASKSMSRGLSFLRNNAVMHFEESTGRLRALVFCDDCPEPVCNAILEFSPVSARAWTAVRDFMRANPISLEDILAGRIEPPVSEYFKNPKCGLLPSEADFTGTCTCGVEPFCSHMAAAICAAAVKIEADPTILFRLRGVHPADLAFISEDDSRARSLAAEPLPLASLDLSGGSTVVVRRRGGLESRVAAVAPADPEAQPEAPSPASPDEPPPIYQAFPPAP
ncbi:MAG: hypothetical protein LBQ12_00050, partial [Deltaproteobacteria bacterium]|nr:hypothetical protein [Deltaproteobacteria bacterium]